MPSRESENTHLGGLGALLTDCANPASVVLFKHLNIDKASLGEALAVLTDTPVTAVETHYYWPDLIADLQEIIRVLKPGGT